MSTASNALRIALVGNPNSGKTALFNQLTGSRQKVANYTGVTAKVGFESDGELKNPAMTLYVYKDGKKVALN